MSASLALAPSTHPNHRAQHRSHPVGTIGIGYEGLALDVFIDQLLAEQVQILVDVRQTPLSRKRGFSKTPLSAALEAAGIQYLHRRELGNPKENREAFHTGAVATGRRRFAQHIARPEAQQALAEVADLSRTAKVALLCFEADVERCHRHVLLEHLPS